ncbi:MAG: hypothetical protein Q9224_003927 [Gallowayella concinna]
MANVGAALKPPPGVNVDYVHSASRGYQVVDASLISITLAAVLVAVRLIVKVGIVHSSGWDDWAMLFSLMFAIAQSTGNVILVDRYGLGHHSYNVPVKNYNPMLNWIHITTVLYLVAILFAKLSILLFLNRLFGINRRFRLTVYAAIACVVSYCLIMVLLIIFRCTPVAATWDLMRERTHCVDLINIDIAIGALNIPSDIFILLLPIPMLRKLQMPLHKKLGLGIIMATGILTLEVNIGIFCGCLPALNPLLRYLKGKRILSGTSLRSLISLRIFTTWSRGTGKSEPESQQVVEASGKPTRREMIETEKHVHDGDSVIYLHGAKRFDGSENTLHDASIGASGDDEKWDDQCDTRDKLKRTDLESGPL